MRNVLVSRPPLRDSLAAATVLGPYFAELDELQRKATGLRHAIEEVARDRKVAIDTDRVAGALAVRRGEPDPGDKAALAINEKTTVLQRKARDTAGALQAVAVDIERELTTSGAGWALEALAQAGQARLDAQAALDAFRDARQLVADLEASARWLRSGGQAKPGARLPSVPGLVRRNGEPFALAVVIDALAAIDDEPVSTEPAEETAKLVEEAVA